MNGPLSKQVRDYFVQSVRVTYDSSDKADIYALLHRAERLIARLLAAANLTASVKRRTQRTP
jgi:hypothetical protein